MKTISLITLLLISHNLYAAYATTDNNCLRKKPDFYQDIFDNHYNEKLIVFTAWVGMNDNFKKPVKYGEVKNMVKGYQYDSFCISGHEDNKNIDARIKGILAIKDGSIIEGDKGRYDGNRIVSFSANVSFDPDRQQGSVTNFKFMELTEAFLNWVNSRE